MKQNNYGVVQHTHRGQRYAQRSERPESGDAGLSTCWRCGVEFDASTFIEGAPCADCQLDDEPGKWVRPTRLSSKAEDVVERRKAVVKLVEQGYLDAEIAAKLGMSAHTAGQIRKRAGLPRNYKVGMNNWKDEEAHRQHAIAISKLPRKRRGRGKRPMNFEGSGTRW